MAAEQFLIKGLSGRKELHGTIRVNGAKNAALKAIAATLLFKDPVTLKNLPDIEDVHRMIDLMEDMGVTVTKKEKHIYVFDAGTLRTSHLPPKISKRLRASIVLTGPLLSRTGQVHFPHPGGCVIGKRPIDLFIEGFQKMGARARMTDETYAVRAKNGKLSGAEIFLRNASVTATETFIMAGVLAKGTTVIKNAALEPEIESLMQFLISCGARIKGVGTTTLEITGGPLLSAKKRSYITPPDRIETGSFLIIGALAASELEITHCNPTHVEALLEVLRYAGVDVLTNADTIRIKRNGKKNSDLTGVDIKTHEYPGFPTDLQAPMAVFLTQVTGESLVFETIFEGRLGYAEELIRMGANIKVMDQHRIIVKGPKLLNGRELESPDLRAGLAFIIAAIVAKGQSLIHNVYNIDRGYENIEERLRQIGLSIERIQRD
ncbi:MAG: UDP-N-acetylglucosamine 1-carboxyvinyltransferase [Patescibacteria group bacterium]